MSTAVVPGSTDYAWGNPGTGWETLTSEEQTRVLDSGVRHWKQIHEKVPTYNERWRPLRPIIMTSSQWAALHALADRVSALILQACQRRARTAGELRIALGVPEGRIRLLHEDEVLSEELLISSRPDILFAGGVPKFVEFNIDGALGGAFDSDNLATAFAAAFATDSVPDLYSVPMANRGRLETINAWLGDTDDRAVAMVMDWSVGHAGPTEPREFLKYLQPVADQAATIGFELIPFWLHMVEKSVDDRLLVDGREINHVWRMFVPDTAPPTDGRDAIEAVVNAGNLRCFTSSASWLLTNKLVLAWLWEDLPLLSAADAEIVRAHIPRTLLLTSDLVADAVARQTELVLKPEDGSSGRDVLIGRDTTADEWRTGVERGVADGTFLLQELVDSDRLPMDFIDIHTEEVVRQGVPCCFGPYLFGHQQCGGEVRMGFPGGGAVMNVGRGALVDGFALIDR